MSIGKNIAKYRKAKGLTQEELGAKLGVTNQAVSKWESEVSLPDVMLLPEITKVLGVTFDDLYANKKTANSENPIKVLDTKEVYSFAQKTQSMVIDSLYNRTNLINCNLWDILKVDKNLETNSYDKIKDNHTLCCLSNEKGAAYISNELTIIDSDIRPIDIDRIFNNPEILSAINKFTDFNIQRVLSSVCREYFCTDYNCNVISLKLDTVVNATGLDTFQVLESVEKLISLCIVQKEIVNKETVYLFTRAKITELAITFRIIEHLIGNQFGFSCGEFAGLISI